MTEAIMQDAASSGSDGMIIDSSAPPVPTGPSMPPPKDIISSRRSAVEAILPTGLADDFDWKEYQSSYKDRALLLRLNHLAHLLMPSSSSQHLLLARDALDKIIPLVKETWDTHLYANTCTALVDPPIRPKRTKGEDVDMDAPVSTSMPEGPKTAEGQGHMDIEWIESVREKERGEMGRLDTELKGYSSNLIKESMRLTYLAFAQVAMKCGKFTDMLKFYANAREYSTSPISMVELGVAVIEACLAFNVANGLPGHISKLEAAMERAYPTLKGPAGRDASLTAADVRDAQERDVRAAGIRRAVGVKIRVARVMVGLHTRDYERAGREAAEALEEGGLQEWEGKAISTSDLALIAAVCTLATGSRERIRRVLLDRASFRSALGDGQAWIIELIRALLEAEYTELSRLLVKAEPALLLCPFTYQHTACLTSAIRLRAMVQYVAPFSSIKIATMAGAFGTSASDMLREVESLILDKQIKGRLDLVDGILEMTQKNERQEMFKEALATGKESSKATKAALLRIRLQEAKIIVDPRPAGALQDEWVDASLYNGAGSFGGAVSDEELMEEMR